MCECNQKLAMYIIYEKQLRSEEDIALEIIEIKAH